MEELFKVTLVDPYMAHSDHHILSMIIDAKVATSAELIFKTHNAMARHKEVARILKEVESYQVTLEERLKEFKAELEHAEDA